MFLQNEKCAVQLFLILYRILPVTEKAAVAAGLAVGQSAVEYTAEGIRNVLLADVKAGK